MKAFIGRSFDPLDGAIKDAVYALLDSLKKVGFEYIDGEDPVNGSISGKIKELMHDREVFVGIATQRHAFMPSQFFLRILGRAEKFSSSIWTWQESGYAHGKGMSVIMLIEDGVDIPETDIMADQEKIFFTRDNLNPCLTKLNSMLLDLITKKSSEFSKSETAIQDEKSDSDQNKNISETKKIEDSPEDQFEFFGNAIKNVEEKKFSDAEKNWSEFLALRKKMGESDAEIATWHLYYLDAAINNGSSKALETLKQEAGRGDDEYVLRYSRVFEEAANVSKAMEVLADAAEGAEYETKSGIYNKMIALKTDAGEFAEAEKIFFNSFSKVENQIKKSVLLDLGAKIAQKMKIDLLTIALKEAALECNPTDQDLRFSLAHAYSENKLHELSLVHYRTLCKGEDQIRSANNLGVAYINLNLKFLGVRQYERSWKGGNIVAAGNLISKYMTAGFGQQALELIESVRKSGKSNSSIDEYAAKLFEEKEQEDKKVEDVEQKAKSQLEMFRSVIKGLDLGSGQEKDFKILFEGIELSIKIKGNRIEGSGAGPVGDKASIEKKELAIEEGFKFGNIMAFKIKATVDGGAGNLYSLLSPGAKESWVLCCRTELSLRALIWDKTECKLIDLPYAK